MPARTSGQSISARVDSDSAVGMILIPAYNEAATIAEVVGEIRAEYDLPVVVIDDMSCDNTAERARAAGAKVLSLCSRLGAWGATQAGVRYAVRHNCAYAVTMDADGQHVASYIAPLLAPLHAGEANVVIGACLERGSTLRQIAWKYFRLLTGFSVEDITSGFRAYDRLALRTLSTSEATLLDYQDVGVLFLLRGVGARTVEVPVPMCERRAGHSRIFRTWFRVVKYMLETTLLCVAKGGRRAPKPLPLAVAQEDRS